MNRTSQIVLSKNHAAERAAPHVVLAGGGTAGHLFPGLAVADVLRQVVPTMRITFVGAGRPLERRCVAAAKYEALTLPCRPLPQRPGEAWRFLRDNLAGYYAARWYLRQHRPSVVIGLGGYASASLLRAAASEKIPFVLLEQNAVPGRATRWLARRARLICTAFAEASANLPRGVPIEMTGNPIRAEIVAARNPSSLRQAGRRLLILGGSGGAQSLNQQLPLAVYKAGASLAGWEIVHQSGPHDQQATASLYAKMGLPARVLPFLDEMPAMLAGTDLAVSRAGGMILSELAAAAVPAILIPFPRATDQHQLRNAQVFHAAGACRIVQQPAGRFDDELATELRTLASDRPLRRQMASAMLRLSRPDAARRVAQLVLELIDDSQLPTAAQRSGAGASP